MANESLSAKAGKILKSLIKCSEYRTQDNFAIAMNVDPVTVRRWIAHGISKIDVIEEIAEKFGKDFIGFFN